MRFSTFALLVFTLAMITWVQAKVSVAKYQRRIEEVRRMINKKPSTPLKTKRYKCVEVTDDEFDTSNNRLWPDDEVTQKPTRLPRPKEEPASREIIREEELFEPEAPLPAAPQMPRARPIPVGERKPLLNPPPANSHPVVDSPPTPIPTVTSASFVQEMPQQYPAPVPQNIRQPPPPNSFSAPSAPPPPPNSFSAPSAPAPPPPPVAGPPRAPGQPPLILSPQHCNMMKYYASMYRLTDIEGWVKKNCGFAKMFLPKASCEEINILVASCRMHEKPKQ